jgi:chromate transporter
MNEPETAAGPVSLRAIFRVFLTAGAVSFGGGVIAYLREYIVNDEHWLGDEQFLDALEVAETLPGLNSVNISVIVGDRLRGALGAVVAVAGLILPGAIVMFGLAAIWEHKRRDPYLTAFLLGVAASAVGLLLTVTLQLGHRQFVRPTDLLIMLATFVAVTLMHFSLVLVLLIVGPIAVFVYRPGSPRTQVQRFQHLRQRHYSHRAHFRH